MKYDEIDKKIIKFLQGDLPLESRPYKKLAESLTLSENEVVKRIDVMKQKKILKRLGVVLRHQKAGYTVNAMVAWKVNESESDNIAKYMIELKEISHCYLREVPDFFEYTLFTMIHARSEEELNKIIAYCSSLDGVSSYKIFKSVKELKKQSMQYF